MIRKRLHGVYRELIAMHEGTVWARSFGATFTEDTFFSELSELIRLQGLRFRVTEDEPVFSAPTPFRKKEKK